MSTTSQSGLAESAEPLEAQGSWITDVPVDAGVGALRTASGVNGTASQDPVVASQPTCRLLQGDCADVVAELPDRSVDLVITSPPYFQQRSYGGPGLGNELRIEDYLGELVDTLVRLLRVVKPTGNIVYNLGDKYEDGSLMLVPYRFALRVLETSLVKLVNDITWVKRNPTPHQYGRRLVSSTEPFFHFALSKDYYYDRDAFLSSAKVAPSRPTPKLGSGYRELIERSELSASQRSNALRALDEAIGDVKAGRIHSFRMKIKGIHAPAYGGQDGGRKIHMDREGFTIIRISGNRMKRDVIESPVGSVKGNGHPAIFPEGIIRELIRLLSPADGTVLDHYVGSGTTLVAALREGRNCVGIELNPEYVRSAERRVLEEVGVTCQTQ